MNVCKLKLTVAAVFNKTGPNQRLQSFLVRTTFRITPSKLLCRSYEGVPSIFSAAVQDVLISVAFLTNRSFFSGFHRFPTCVKTFGHIGLTVDDAIQSTIQLGVSSGGVPTVSGFVEFLVLFTTEYRTEFLTSSLTGNTVRFVIPYMELLLADRYRQSTGIGHLVNERVDASRVDSTFEFFTGTLLFEQTLYQIVGRVILRRVCTYCNGLPRFGASSIRFYLFFPSSYPKMLRLPRYKCNKIFQTYIYILS